MIKKTFTIYVIKYNDTIVYYGRTNNIRVRQATHNRDYRKNLRKELYSYLRSKGVEHIQLIPIYVCSSLIESKRMECYLILKAHFDKKLLYQNIPKIRD